ncbi:hypothetical protein BJX96DRAFT_168368 [Aspergillus floccosus]
MLSRTSSQGSEISELPLPNEWKALLRGLLDKGVKVTVQDVQRMWQLAVNRVSCIDGLVSQTLWIETGSKRAGLQHILEQHSKEFSHYEPQRLMELAEASTSIGLPLGIQGKRGHTRPIFGLFFYGEPLAVAVQVGSNGFVVSMNPVGLEKLVRRNPQNMTVRQLVTLLQQSHQWPRP